MFVKVTLAFLPESPVVHVGPVDHVRPEKLAMKLKFIEDNLPGATAELCGADLSLKPIPFSYLGPALIEKWQNGHALKRDWYWTLLLGFSDELVLRFGLGPRPNYRAVKNLVVPMSFVLTLNYVDQSGAIRSLFRKGSWPKPYRHPAMLDSFEFGKGRTLESTARIWRQWVLDKSPGADFAHWL